MLRRYCNRLYRTMIKRLRKVWRRLWLTNRIVVYRGMTSHVEVAFPEGTPRILLIKFEGMLDRKSITTWYTNQHTLYDDTRILVHVVMHYEPRELPILNEVNY